MSTNGVVVFYTMGSKDSIYTWKHYDADPPSMLRLLKDFVEWNGDRIVSCEQTAGNWIWYNKNRIAEGEKKYNRVYGNDSAQDVYPIVEKSLRQCLKNKFFTDFFYLIVPSFRKRNIINVKISAYEVIHKRKMETIRKKAVKHIELKVDNFVSDCWFDDLKRSKNKKK